MDFYLQPGSSLFLATNPKPMDFYPVLFAVPRVVGWLAHWRQMMLQSGGVKIWRPRQLYVGEPERDYVEIETRTDAHTATGLGKEPTKVKHEFSKRAFLATYKGKREQDRPSKL